MWILWQDVWRLITPHLFIAFSRWVGFHPCNIPPTLQGYFCNINGLLILISQWFNRYFDSGGSGFSENWEQISSVLHLIIVFILQPFKGIVHFEFNFWYVLACLKCIQDVGVFVSTVFSILICLGQTVLVCQSYNGGLWGPPQRVCTEKSKLNMI